jgi:5-methylcytosine-specific restriction endonuclease McrA
MPDNERPPIPAELKRRVLMEAGYRCAVCRHIDTIIHHIISWEQCKSHEYENLIALCPNCHSIADKGKIDPKALRLYKANLRFAFEKYSQFEMDVLFELSKVDFNTTPAIPYVSLFVN